MRPYRVRFTTEARKDLHRLYDHWLDRDLDIAKRALFSIRAALRLVAYTPFSCRAVSADDPFLRELIIPFGASGYVALLQIARRTVNVIAVRHQYEDDYE